MIYIGERAPLKALQEKAPPMAPQLKRFLLGVVFLMIGSGAIIVCWISMAQEWNPNVVLPVSEWLFLMGCGIVSIIKGSSLAGETASEALRTLCWCMTFKRLNGSELKRFGRSAYFPRTAVHRRGTQDWMRKLIQVLAKGVNEALALRDEAQQKIDAFDAEPLGNSHDPASVMQICENKTAARKELHLNLENLRTDQAEAYQRFRRFWELGESLTWREGEKDMNMLPLHPIGEPWRNADAYLDSLKVVALRANIKV